MRQMHTLLMVEAEPKVRVGALAWHWRLIESNALPKHGVVVIVGPKPPHLVHEAKWAPILALALGQHKPKPVQQKRR
jgi:hypothetical protein